MERFNYIVIGGGIAGVTCAETLSQWSPDDEILLLTASPLIKAITNFKMVSKTLEEFDVEEKPMSQLNAECPNVKVRHDTVTQLDSEKKIVSTAGGHEYEYGKICICTGGTPKVIAEGSPHVIGIRDTETVKVFQKKLKNARRIVLVGNGGIATELAYEVEGCEVVWAIRDSSITSTFVDAGAAEFFLPQLAADKESEAGLSKRLKYTLDETSSAAGDKKEVLGSALGPDWSAGLDMHGTVQSSHQVHIEYKVEVERVLSPEDVKKENIVPEVLPSEADSQKAEDWPVYVMLTNNKVLGCDFVVSATGVVPNTDPFTKGNKFDISEDGGIKVNERMETNIHDVYAAGDVCTASWELAPHWIQMRLWSQARQMGHYAAKCMLASTKGEDVIMDFCFELFAHVTKFFNYKVILLGKFNAQGLGKDHELLLRVTKGKEYIKVVLKDGRMEGAILIGETDLEETFENLILNKMDLSVYGEDLLNPDIDIEDYFD